MSRLYDGGILDTNWIKVIKQPEVKKIVSTLLDGSEHVQNISEVTRLEIEIVADKIVKGEIDSLDASGDLVNVIDNEGSEYTGRIVQKSPWKKFNDILYQTTLTLSVEVI